MGLVKDIYSTSFYDQIAGRLAAIDPAFNRNNFIAKIFSNEFENMEWKERTKHTTKVLHNFLPAEFKIAVKTILELITQLQKDKVAAGLEFVILPDYIETYGINDFRTSVTAFEIITQFISCEFAVRPFLIKYEGQMIAEMIKWSLHQNDQVRRLASEGSRPRLPWAMAIPFLKKDPNALLPILNNLKSDPSESVRRSVANNLNDISKDHPDFVIKIGKEWQGNSKETDAIIKHGSRTLLKQGHPNILKHFGLNSSGFIVNRLQVLPDTIKIGQSLKFAFRVRNGNKQPSRLRLEYGIYYLKANNTWSKKIFKISEKIYGVGETNDIERQQSFKVITTRVFYEGEHKLSIIVNGIEMQEKPFTILL